MQTSDFDYDLPRELIATRPAHQRDQSRLLVLDRSSGQMQHRVFADLPSLLQPGDLLIVNQSRVIKARLHGQRRTTGASVEILLLEQMPRDASTAAADTQTWRAMCRPARKVVPGEWIDFADGHLPARVLQELEAGERLLEFSAPDILPLLDQWGELPLPPYIVQRRKETADADDVDDANRYQTVYSREPGSVAAPTAGLHFTPALLADLESRGIKSAPVTLHVGAGTFKPVEVENPADHPIHAEICEVPADTARAISATRAAGGRIIAVGTTSVRALESAWDPAAQQFRSGRFSTRLLILPGYNFGVVDAMITNFHLPKSSLLMMISAFAGHEHVMNAYREAIARQYRFYSYGDAMLIS